MVGVRHSEQLLDVVVTDDSLPDDGGQEGELLQVSQQLTENPTMITTMICYCLERTGLVTQLLNVFKNLVMTL